MKTIEEKVAPLLKNTGAAALWYYWLAPVAERPEPVPPCYRYLFCCWGRAAPCYQTLTFDGLQNNAYVFRCRNCKTLAANKVRQLAKSMNVDIEVDAKIYIDRSFFTPDQLVDGGFAFPNIKHLEPPIDPIYKSVDMTEGNRLYSKFVEVVDPLARYMYYARGFSNHPDLAVGRSAVRPR